MKIDGYKFGNKNNWRRWVWNQIQERLTVPKKDAVVLYLAGIDDLDRGVAIQKGFSPNNLLAVDHSTKVISALKAKGVLCVNGSIADVMAGFVRSKTKIDVFIGDFCSGLTSETGRLLRQLTDRSCREAFAKESVVALNFLRGRDKGELLNEGRAVTGNQTRHRGEMFFSVLFERAKSLALEKSTEQGLELRLVNFVHSVENLRHDLVTDIENSKNKTNELNKSILDLERMIRRSAHDHKANLFRVRCKRQLGILRGLLETFNNIIQDQKKLLNDNIFLTHQFRSIDDYLDGAISDLKEKMFPSFFQYKSGPAFMDSVVFNYLEADCLPESADGAIAEFVSAKELFGRKVNALMAIRSMRQNGTLKASPRS